MAGARQQQGRDTDRALEEAALAVRQVELPQPAEARVEALCLHRGQLRQEALAPGAQGQRIGVPEILLGDQLQVAGSGLGRHDRVDRWNETTREDVAFDVVDAAPGLLVAVSRYSAPMASIISIETSLSNWPCRSR
ncbi:hypothetical protein G6F54_013943 [Rhizopus delemar]|nr:hypothetical protein G6F54_013943 [Rhizopus delemar]